jgi:hypothetical protein
MVEGVHRHCLQPFSSFSFSSCDFPRSLMPVTFVPFGLDSEEEEVAVTVVVAAV